MSFVQLKEDNGRNSIDFSKISPEITSWDEEAFRDLISTELSPKQQDIITNPTTIYTAQKEVLAVHWHPEFIPMDLIKKRIKALFPNQRTALIIPTQHNVIMSYDDYCGVEVDCYSSSFNRKVQLLIHFSTPKLNEAGFLIQMLAHTFKYRSTQLFEFLDTILNPVFEERLKKAATITGADQDLVQFVKIYVGKLNSLIEKHKTTMHVDMLKNKLIRNYFNLLRAHYPDVLINRAQIFLKTVKEIVKANFNLEYFYQTEEIIEEARALGAGIIIPHPEQFWPILLADYDVDGYEVWNPQSREFTEFLINVVHSKNKNHSTGEKPLLIFMGDDTHMSEKILPTRYQEREKANRELGVQSAWDDVAIRKSLILAGFDRTKIIAEYKSRLDG